MTAGLLALLLVTAQEPDTFRLAELQSLAVSRDARVERAELEAAATSLRVASVRASRLPELWLRSEATRQSEVARLPLASAGVPEPPKTRFEAAVGAEWLLFDGGVTSAREGAERAALGTAHASLEAELYGLRLEVADAYFDALILQARQAALTALIEDLTARLAELRERVLAGAALAGDTAALRAEMLEATQALSEVRSERAASLTVLESLTGAGVTGDAVLVVPDLYEEVERVRAAAAPGAAPPGVPRVHPRYAVFDARREQLERQAAVVGLGTRPKVSAFGEFAYGRPGLRLFTDGLGEWWLAGLRFRWTPWDRGVAGRETEILRIESRILEAEESAFSEALARQAERPLHAIERLRSAIAVDEQIIALREQAERQARAQFAETAITAAEYVTVRTELQEARIALARRRAELARAQALYLTILGMELQ